MKQTKFYVLALLLIAAIAMAACTPAATTTAEPSNDNDATEEVTQAPAATEEVTETEAAEETATEDAGTTGDKVQVRWFVGLGAGTDAGTIEPQQNFVDEFNANNDHIELVLEIVDHDVAYDTLSTEIAAGNPPDIVGPTGIAGRDSFKGAWLDLNPLIEANNYDLSDFDPATVKFLEVKEEGQLGIPFAIYPSFIL